MAPQGFPTPLFPEFFPCLLWPQTDTVAGDLCIAVGDCCILPEVVCVSLTIHSAYQSTVDENSAIHDTYNVQNYNVMYVEIDQDMLQVHSDSTIISLNTKIGINIVAWYNKG